MGFVNVRRGVWPDLPQGVRGILFATGGVFLVQLLSPGARFEALWGLSREGLRHGMVWQPLTYQFLHWGFGHLLMNLLVLYFLGPPVERALGKRPFLVLYFLGGLLGGLGFVWMSSGGLCVGASGAVFGVMAAFVALFPDQPMSLLLFPFVTFKAWVLVTGIFLLELLYLVSGAGGNVAHAAHVAGAVAGYCFTMVATGRWGARSRPPRPPAGRAEDPRAVDAVLDKVAREGLGRLTRAERELLERASRRYRGTGGS